MAYNCEVCKDTGMTWDATEQRMVPCGRIECKVKSCPNNS